MKKKDFLELVCLYFGSSFSGALSSHQYLIKYALRRTSVNSVGAHPEGDCAGRLTRTTDSLALTLLLLFLCERN